MNFSDDNIVLHEDEVPGASLRGRDVGSLKIPELKQNQVNFLIPNY